MISAFTHDFGKKLRFAVSFLRRRLIHVNLQVLYECNYRCRICDFWKEGHRNDTRLTAAEVAVIAKKLHRIGPQIVSIGGGEPTLHPEILGIVRALAPYHFPVMITNGSKITPRLARDLFSAGMVEISVSLDYATPQAHDRQRGMPGAFEQGVEALKILQANRTHPEQRINLISVIMDDNLAEVEPLIRLCEQLGITYLVTLYSHSRGAKASRAASLEVSRRLLELKARHRHFVALRGYLERFSVAVAQGGIAPCYAGRNLCNVGSRGEVSLCIDHMESPVGNLLTDDVFEIERRLRASHQANRCQDCWTSCRGSIEAILYGRRPWLNLLDYYHMTRPVPLTRSF